MPTCGVTGPAVLRSAEPVALGRWHRVMAERVHKDGTLVVDGGAPVQRSSPGKSQGLNLRSPLYLGGVEPPLQPPTNASFQGCIGEVSPGPPSTHPVRGGGDTQVNPPLLPVPCRSPSMGRRWICPTASCGAGAWGSAGRARPACMHPACTGAAACPCPTAAPPSAASAPPASAVSVGRSLGGLGVLKGCVVGATCVRAPAGCRHVLCASGCAQHMCVCHAVLHASAVFVCVEFARMCCVHLECVHVSCVCCNCALCMFVCCVGVCRACIYSVHVCTVSAMHVYTAYVCCECALQACALCICSACNVHVCTVCMCVQFASVCICTHVCAGRAVSICMC